MMTNAQGGQTRFGKADLSCLPHVFCIRLYDHSVWCNFTRYLHNLSSCPLYGWLHLSPIADWQHNRYAFVGVAAGAKSPKADIVVRIIHYVQQY